MNATKQSNATSQDAALPRMGAVVLAAGAGRRMGHRPKCLLQLNGRSLIDRQLEAVFQAGLVSVLVVLGHMRNASNKKRRSSIGARGGW